MSLTNKFSHTDENGKANMVDVGDKPLSKRVAKASGHISLSQETIVLIKENGIMAAKKTYELIPLCHQLLLNKADVRLTIAEDGIRAESYVSCTGNTGVEMEALTAVSVALLTVYDMCKAVDKKMIIGGIELIEKTKTSL